MPSSLTQKRLKELVSYDSVTGVFLWRVSRRGSAKQGSECGSYTRKSGKTYRQIRVDGKRYMAHRLAWLYCHSEFPENEIDHIDGCGENNCIANLRSVSHSENHRNTRLRSNSKSGITGVSWDSSRGKWKAQVKINGCSVTLGRFYSIAEAARARNKANQEYEFHENHGSERGL